MTNDHNGDAIDHARRAAAQIRACLQQLRATGLLPDSEIAETVADLGQPTPTLLDMNYRTVRRLAAQGWVLGVLTEQVQGWPSIPDRPLSDMLKAMPRHRVEHLARELQRVGLHDLDDVLLPDPGMSAFDLPIDPDNQGPS